MQQYNYWFPVTSEKLIVTFTVIIVKIKGTKQFWSTTPIELMRIK